MTDGKDVRYSTASLMASVNKCDNVVGVNLEISRGDGTEAAGLDWSKIENIIVYDENGTEIRVRDIYQNKKTILVLVRVSDVSSSQNIGFYWR